MNLRFYIEKLKCSDIFKEFMKENPKAYFCSGFFTLDFDGNDNQKHLDFYVPDKKQKFSFCMNLEVEKTKIEILDDKVLSKISLSTNFDFDEVKESLIQEIEKNSIKHKPQKILISLQNIKKKQILICTIFMPMLGIIKAEIDLESKKVISFEKKSLFDLIKRVK